MAKLGRTSGFTLIECMIALAVLLIGSLGLLSLHTVGLRLNADARVITQATALAQDLITQMQTWDYANDPRLRNANPGNDVKYADKDGDFEKTMSTTFYDHEESELEAGGATWLGVPTATAQQMGFTRYWNITEQDTDSNGAVVGRRIAVIVRWERKGVGRRIVVVTFLKDPAVTN